MHCLPNVLRFEEHRQKQRRQCFFQNIAKTLQRKGESTMLSMMFEGLGTP